MAEGWEKGGTWEAESRKLTGRVVQGLLRHAEDFDFAVSEVGVMEGLEQVGVCPDSDVHRLLWPLCREVGQTLGDDVRSWVSGKR